MHQPQTLRLRAINAIIAKLGDKSFLPIDNVIDTYARKIFNLPDRPEGNLPYVGWLGSSQSVKPPGMSISEAGKDLIKKWEGFRSNAYQCSADVWTIGYGHTKGVKPGDTMSRREAIALFDTEIQEYEAMVKRQVKVSLSQGQYDALVSFTYNLGEGALQQSTLLKLVNKEQFHAAANEFSKWVNAGGQRLQGLVNRRNEERSLFVS